MHELIGIDVMDKKGIFAGFDMLSVKAYWCPEYDDFDIGIKEDDGKFDFDSPVAKMLTVLSSGDITELDEYKKMVKDYAEASKGDDDYAPGEMAKCLCGKIGFVSYVPVSGSVNPLEGEYLCSCPDIRCGREAEPANTRNRAICNWNERVSGKRQGSTSESGTCQ